MPRLRFLCLGILLLVFLLFSLGCTRPETPQEGPENLREEAQYEQVLTGRDQCSTGEEITVKKRKTTAPVPEEQEEQQPTRKQQNPTISPGKEIPGLVPANVTRVVDGDTVYVNFASGKQEKVRFTGVDTPELTREIEPYGKKAAAYTRSRLDGRNIWLEMDVQERDRYGRLLAYIWLDQPESDNGKEVRAKMFNAELHLEGYAQVMTIPPNVKYADHFVKYQREARNAGKGLWGLVREDIEEYYVASKNSNKFHRPDCKWGQKIVPRNLIRFNSVDEAFDAGYEPCKVCRP